MCCVLVLIFFVSWFGFRTRLTFIFVLIKKSCGLGCFHPRNNLNKLQSSLICYFLFVLRSCLHQLKNILVVLRNFWIGKSSTLWIYCSFVNYSSFDLFGKRLCNTTTTKRTMDQLTWQVWGSCSKFRGFVSQMCLVIRFYFHSYLTGPTEVGIIGILLLGMALAWFTPLLTHFTLTQWLWSISWKTQCCL